MFVFGTWTADLVAASIVLIGIVYFYVKHQFNYWKRRNVPYIEPTFGNTTKQLWGKVHTNEYFDEFYPHLKKHGYVGWYNLTMSALLVSDPEIIKQILAKDFSSFPGRGFPTPFDPENDPLSANLFNLSGTHWKNLRAKLSPTFTSGKIKEMFHLIHEVTEEFKDCLRVEMRKKNGSVDLKDWLARYATDVIGTCAFGVSCNSLKDSKSEFHQMGRSITDLTFFRKVKFTLMFAIPILGKRMTFTSIFPEATNFFLQLMDRTVKYRKENNVQRNDFVQLMMKLLEEEADEKVFNLDIMTAQAFLFFLAGMDNVANNIGFCLHALALDPDLQQRVHNEIETVLKQNDGKMSYEALKKMDIVSRCVDEGLRLYTPAGVIMRELSDDSYVIPGTDIKLEKKTQVVIPIQAIFNDGEIFPNPRKFDPDRFTEEEKAKRHPYSYIPFGEGPRMCIAARFAQLEMRLCLAQLIRQFEFSVAPETDVTAALDPKMTFGPTPKNGFWLRITERNTA